MTAEKKTAEKKTKATEAPASTSEDDAAAGEESTPEWRRLDDIVHSLQELGQVAGRAGESLRSNIGRAPEAVRDGIGHTEEKIRERPLTSIGVAAGVGLLLGLLINRRP